MKQLVFVIVMLTAFPALVRAGAECRSAAGSINAVARVLDPVGMVRRAPVSIVADSPRELTLRLPSRTAACVEFTIDGSTTHSRLITGGEDISLHPLEPISNALGQTGILTVIFTDN